MRLTKKFLAGIVSAALLVGAPTAFAQSSAQQGYSKPGGIVETQLDNGNRDNNPGTSVTTPEATSESSGGNLPFTGLDLALVAGAGGLLVALGLGMRRLSRSTGVA